MRIVSTDPDHPGVFAFGQIAVGIIAFGQSALGVVAIGQLARGVFCLGQGAVGVVAVGQGAVGLWHGTGMVAGAGQTGYGLALHLLPRVVTERPSDLPPPTPLASFLDRKVSEGWLAARIVRGGLLELEEGEAKLDASAVHGDLLAAVDHDRAMVKVRANIVVESSGYRDGQSHVDLVAEKVVTYSSRPRWHLAYGTPPGGKPGKPATPGAIVARSIVWLIMVGVVWVVAFLPLIDAFVE